MGKIGTLTTRVTTASVVSCLVILFMFLGGCSSSLHVASRWSDQPPLLDGSLRDWTDSTAFVEKDGVRFGVMNDGDYIYVCLLSSNPGLGRQVMFRGMTVWFDPNGGEKKTIGVKFPLGMTRSDVPPAGSEGDADQNVNRPDLLERQVLNDFEFIGPTEHDLQRVSRLQGQGVEMHLTSTMERFIYELKIPLVFTSQHPYAVETHAGAPVGIGVEPNNQQARSSEGEGGPDARGGGGGGGMRGGGRGGMGGGGRGGRMGGGGGPSGGTRGAGTATMPSFWTHVQLAEK